MPATYEPIATTTLGSAATAINFSSIPATYTDLRVVLVGTTAVACNPGMRFNGSSSGYSVTSLYGDGTSATSSRGTSRNAAFLGWQATTSTTIPTLWTADIFNYRGSTFKTCLCTASTDQNGSGVVERNVNLWQTVDAITTVALLATGTQFSIGTTATIYGILKA